MKLCSVVLLLHVYANCCGHINSAGKLSDLVNTVEALYDFGENLVEGIYKVINVDDFILYAYK